MRCSVLPTYPRPQRDHNNKDKFSSIRTRFIIKERLLFISSSLRGLRVDLEPLFSFPIKKTWSWRRTLKMEKREMDQKGRVAKSLRCGE
jgi:hypothetical protein